MPVNRGTQSLVAKLPKQVERASETADLVNEANGMINRSGVEIDWFSRPLTCRVAGDHRKSNQRHKLTLSISVTVDVPLGSLD